MKLSKISFSGCLADSEKEDKEFEDLGGE